MLIYIHNSHLSIHLLLIRSIKGLVLPELQRLLLLTLIALLGIMAHRFLTPGRFLCSPHAAVLRPRHGISKATCVLVVNSPCGSRVIDILGFGRRGLWVYGIGVVPACG